MEKRVGCLGSFLNLFGIEGAVVTENYPYALRDDFLSVSEFSFYKVLVTHISDDYIVCPKVSLSDIFFVTDCKGENKFTYLNKINRKHVDFLICTKNKMEPVCGIELDDSSHSRADRVERDRFVNKLFAVSKLPLVRIKAINSYNQNEIITKIEENIQGLFSIRCDSQSPEKTEEQICPKCGAKMVLRTATRGANKGE